MDMAGLKADVREQARRLGFAAFGVTSVRPFAEARTRALAAIDAGRMDGMAWYTRDRVEASADIGGRYPWARSIIALAWPYQPARPDPPLDGTGGAMVRGRFSAYACTQDGGRSVDYHDLLAQRCDALVEWLGERVDGVRAKRFVDHGWALDRAIAERAGVGFAGKHASVITLAAGSYVLLAIDRRVGVAPGRRTLAARLRPLHRMHSILSDRGDRRARRHRRPAVHLLPHHRAPRADS